MRPGGTGCAECSRSSAAFTAVLLRACSQIALRATLSEKLHVVLAAEMQAPCGARFDACRLQPFAHAVRTQRAFINSFGRRIEFWDVERASGDAVAAADAVGLLEIDDAIGVLHNGPVRGPRRQTSRLCTMHALILSHL